MQAAGTKYTKALVRKEVDMFTKLKKDQWSQRVDTRKGGKNGGR